MADLVGGPDELDAKSERPNGVWGRTGSSPTSVARYQASTEKC